jgi:hypothetical protein
MVLSGIPAKDQTERCPTINELVVVNAKVWEHDHGNAS